MASSLFEKLAQTQRLPSPSATAMRVLQMADQENVSINEVADTLISDPALSARLLKYANSPLVGARAAVTSIRHAVTLLGLRAVKVTALSFSLVSNRDASRCPRFKFDLFWAHAAAIASAARYLVSRTCPSLQEEAFVVGLLSRIGKLVMATGLPAEYDALLEKVGSVMRSAVEDERAALTTDHVELGAELLGRWRLPALLVDAVRNQNAPDRTTDRASRLLAGAVKDAQAIADVLCGLDAAPSERVRAIVSDEQLAEVSAQFREIAGMLDISLKDLPDPGELEDRAKHLLAELSLATHAENETIRAEKKSIEEEKQQLEKRALVDSLTNVGNRAAFDRQLAAEWARAERYHNSLSLLMLDLDRFKSLNDTYGHVAGDEVLRAAAECMAGVIRASDFLARYGGEEFAVIATETDVEAAVQLAERIRVAVAARTVRHADQVLRMTVSIGVIGRSGPLAQVTPAQFIAAADKQLYRAKRAGRNRCFAGKLDAPAALRT